MQKWLLFLAIFTSLFSEILSEEAVSTQTDTKPNIVKFMGETVIPYMKREHITGVGVALYYNNKEYIVSYGIADKEKNTPVTPDTLFDIASVTKVFTSTDLALQVIKGKMTLNDPVVMYLPGMERARGKINQITLLQLATHTSGLPREPPALPGGQKYDQQMILEYLLSWKPSQKKKRQGAYLYSNLAFGVLGYAEANLERKPFELVLKDDILTPLGMTSTMITVPNSVGGRYALGYTNEGIPVRMWWRNAWPGGGALRSTPRDLLIFVEANMGIRGPEDLKEAMKLAQKGYVPLNKRVTMGLGWERYTYDNLLIIEKNGGLPGFSSYIGFVPSKQIGIVILANKTKAKTTQIGRLLLTALSKVQDN